MSDTFFGTDREALSLSLLRSSGYREIKNGLLRKPSPGHKMTERERRAINYLIEEWDFEGLEDA